MPKTKTKTHQATAKRVRLTKSGKLLRKRACARHLLAKRSSRQKRSIAVVQEVAPADRKKYHELVGRKPE
jgi:large subunit ribosomal protein L35